MDMLGNREEAEALRTWIRGFELRYGKPSVLEGWRKAKATLPGWEFLGCGSYRSVWRSPLGVAYKVQHYLNDGSNSNSREWNILKEAEKKTPPQGVRLPRAQIWCDCNGGHTGTHWGVRCQAVDAVMAMECVAGEILYRYDCPADEKARLEVLMWSCGRIFNLKDMHDENVMVEKETGVLIPVDFGC